MRWILLTVAALAIGMGPAAGDDLFVRDAAIKAGAAPTSAAEPLILDLKLGRAGAVARAEAWLADDRTGGGEDAADLWLELCDRRFARGLYAAAIAACENAAERRPTAAAPFLAFLKPLKDVPPVSWSKGELVLPLDERGLFQAESNGEVVTTLIDSGAEVAIVMESAAKRLGGRPLAGAAALETTTTPVSGSIVVFDRLAIGNAELRNLPAVVLSDEQYLAGPGDDAPLILSLWALVSSRRAAYLDHGRTLALGDAAPPPAADAIPLVWHSSGVGFAADFARGRREVHFDTGSGRHWLFPAALSALSAEEAASRRPHSRKIGGVGGERIENASIFPSVALKIAGRAWTIAPIEMAEQDENGEAARIGRPMTEKFEKVILDFESMTLSVSE